MTRRLALVLLVALLPAPAGAAADAAALDAAALALAEHRLDEARPVIAALLGAAPGDERVLALAGELAFLDGDYDRAVGLLGRAGPAAGGRLALAETTRATTAGFVSRVSPGGHFVVSCAPGRDELLLDLAGEGLELARAALAADLGLEPPGQVRVEILARVADLARVSELPAEQIEKIGTIALAKYEKLVAVSPGATVFGYPWLDTLAHEYVHHAVSIATAGRAPVFLQEALAKLEEARWRAAVGDPARGLGRLERHLLAVALGGVAAGRFPGRIIGFAEMSPSLALLPSAEEAALAFAEVHSFALYLEGRLGAAGLAAVLHGLRRGVSAEDAIAAACDQPFLEVIDAWLGGLRRLGLRPDPGLALPAPPRLRRGEGDKDDNVGLAGLPEPAQRAARLGGILRARHHLLAAALEYEKARLAAPDDPALLGKLARTRLELDQPELAAAAAAAAVARDEDDAGAQASLGAARLALGDEEGALPHLLAALRVSPFDPAVRCGLERVFTARGDARAAREAAACRQLRSQP